MLFTNTFFLVAVEVYISPGFQKLVLNSIAFERKTKKEQMQC